MRETALFLLPLSRGAAEASHTARRAQAKREGWRSSFRGHTRQPASSRGVTLMVFISLPEITRWGNFYSRLPGARGLSPSHRGGLRAPFFWCAQIPRRGLGGCRWRNNKESRYSRGIIRCQRRRWEGVSLGSERHQVFEKLSHLGLSPPVADRGCQDSATLRSTGFSAHRKQINALGTCGPA